MITVRIGPERVLSGEHCAADEDAGEDDVHEVSVVNNDVAADANSATAVAKQHMRRGLAAMLRLGAQLLMVKYE